MIKISFHCSGQHPVEHSPYQGERYSFKKRQSANQEARKFFEEFVQPRAVHGIKDYLALDLIPKIEGIYRKDLIEILKRENFDFFDYKKPSVDAVLLSHAHLDHAGYISFLDENIPIFCSNETKKILEVLEIIKTSNCFRKLI